MDKPEQQFSGGIASVLRWVVSICLVVAIYLGVWVALLHGYQWWGDSLLQRQEIVDYLLGKGANVLPEMGFLNLAEKRHLLDVRRLFASIASLFYLLLPISLLLLMLQRRFASGRVSLRVAWLGLGLILLPGLLMLLGGFVPLFIFLHTFLFPPNTWVFPDDSILIRLFPLDYFFRFGLAYVAMLVIIFVSMIGWGHTHSRSS